MQKIVGHDWKGIQAMQGKTPDDAANARLEVKCMGTHKVRYTWYA